ncbi:DUF6456 domain-containing protein [Microvirga terrae]|uniref:DUF6456 domain-containing protein n=1 Tax=Microvirga terrae TaxID=2740529 RepID=A0ABY5RMT1_9HYPH|nr:DUF6456 domain-containing protein [Microvirga terrae]UVF18278.1 DUF6456 domain-containing protein [Microvirga terrae]
MNIDDRDEVHETIAEQGIPASNSTRAGRRSRKQARRDGTVGGQPTGEILSREAWRLLTALSQPETWAMVDPTDMAKVLVHRRRSGISVGAGSFAATAAEALVRHDLARWEPSASGRRALARTAAGEAYLRRVSAPDAEMAFLHQHHETELATVATDAGPARVRVDSEESPLDWLRRRKGRNGEPLIDEASYQAGDRLRTDIMLAGLLPGVTARFDGMPKSAGPVTPGEATDRMVAARQRLRNAFDALGGDFSDLLLDLCGFLKGLEQIERERQWPARSAKVVVRFALARLAEHYGIEASARGPAASRGIRAWQAVVIDGGRL